MSTPRDVSVTWRAASYAQETDQVFLCLLEIDQDALSSTIRIVNNTQNITHNGNLYTAFPFEFTLPQDSDENMPAATVTIDNVDRQIVEMIRSLTGPATVTVTVVLASSPDTIEAGPYEMTLRDTGYDAFQVTGRLDVEDMLNEPYPADSFTPNTFPGLF